MLLHGLVKTFLYEHLQKGNRARLNRLRPQKEKVKKTSSRLTVKTPCIY